jgi:hypothetical protein
MMMKTTVRAAAVVAVLLGFAFGEGLGLIKSFRVVVDECLEEGDKRTEVLAGLDRSIRQLQGHLDNNCQ